MLFFSQRWVMKWFGLLSRSTTGDSLRATLADGEIVLNVREKTSLRGPSAKRSENSR